MEFMSAFQKHLVILTAFLKKKIINFETWSNVKMAMLTLVLVLMWPWITLDYIFLC